ncbi:MAG: hypothetical protein GF401_15555 [Chitinivibrionales bacterium]|nr:hypothetical protein [Chitinivibrionales bacterium]
MNNIKMHLIFLLSALACILHLHCSSSSPTADGGGTETTNGITVAGIADTENGQPAAGASVQIRPISCLPKVNSSVLCESDDCFATVTDSTGFFSVDVPFDRRMMVSIIGIDSLIFAQTIPLVVESIWTGPFELQPPGTLNVKLDTVENKAINSGHMRIYGLEGTVSFSSVNSVVHPLFPHGDFAVNILGYTVSDTLSANTILNVQKNSGQVITMFDICENLVAHWPLDEIDGDSCADNSGNGYDGHREGTEPADGKINGSLKFKDNSDKITISKKMSPPQQGTLSFWINIADTGQSQARIISSTASMFEISLRKGRISNELFAHETDYLLDTTILATNIWNHIACTWNMTSGLSEIYVNGIKSSEGIHADDDPGEVFLTLGQSELHGSPFRGLLDDIKIYGKVLNDKEIRALADGIF